MYFNLYQYTFILVVSKAVCITGLRFTGLFFTGLGCAILVCAGLGCAGLGWVGEGCGGLYGTPWSKPIPRLLWAVVLLLSGILQA